MSVELQTQIAQMFTDNKMGEAAADALAQVLSNYAQVINEGADLSTARAELLSTVGWQALAIAGGALAKADVTSIGGALSTEKAAQFLSDLESTIHAANQLDLSPVETKFWADPEFLALFDGTPSTLADSAMVSKILELPVVKESLDDFVDMLAAPDSKIVLKFEEYVWEPAIEMMSGLRAQGVNEDIAEKLVDLLTKQLDPSGGPGSTEIAKTLSRAGKTVVTTEDGIPEAIAEYVELLLNGPRTYLTMMDAPPMYSPFGVLEADVSFEAAPVVSNAAGGAAKNLTLAGAEAITFDGFQGGTMSIASVLDQYVKDPEMRETALKLLGGMADLGPAPDPFSWGSAEPMPPPTPVDINKERVMLKITTSKEGEEVFAFFGRDVADPQKLRGVFFCSGGGCAGGTFDGAAPWNGCLEKPVVYLYPEKPTDVTVQVNLKGAFLAQYPKANKTHDTWEMRATPEGTLFDTRTEKKYGYLFWEGTNQLPIEIDPQRAYLVEGKNAETFLEKVARAYDLNDQERTDFVSYWIAPLQNNDTSLVQLLTTDEYAQHAPMTVTPTPDTVIRLFMVFRRAHGMEQTGNPDLPQLERKGFTVVEWGGMNMDRRP